MQKKRNQHFNKLNYHRDSVQCGKGRSRSVKVICCGIYDLLLALDSNLTSTFNCSQDITPTLHLSISHLSSRWNWKKTTGSRWTCFGVRVSRHWTIQPWT